MSTLSPHFTHSVPQLSRRAVATLAAALVALALAVAILAASSSSSPSAAPLHLSGGLPTQSITPAGADMVNSISPAGDDMEPGINRVNAPGAGR